MEELTRSEPNLSNKLRVQYSLGVYRPEPTGDLIRIGRVYDGGYVINERALRQARYLLSFGVNDDWSFEADFLSRNPHAKAFCFDHSVSKNIFKDKIIDSLNQILSLRFILGVLSLNFPGARNKISYFQNNRKVYRDFCQFIAQPNLSFISKGVSSEASASFLAMDDVFHLIPQDALTENSVFIKMDIEQSEYRALPELFRFRKYVSGLVIEFHDLDILWTNFAALMHSFHEDFAVTHIHGNNFCRLIPNTTTPKLLEVTLLKRSLLQEDRPVPASPSYPIPGLDYPNDPAHEDYPLHF